MTLQYTSTQWTSTNPILTNGDIGIETDTGRAKIGNGLYTWLDLPYFVSGVGVIGDMLRYATPAPTYEIIAPTVGSAPTGNVLSVPFTSDATDHSGNGRNPTITGDTPTYDSSGVHLDGHTNIAFGNPSSCFNLTNFTYCGFFTVSNPAIYQNLFIKMSGGTFSVYVASLSNQWYIIVQDGIHTVEFSAGAGGSAVISAGTPTHFALVRDNAGWTIKLYINGSLISSKTDTTSAGLNYTTDSLDIPENGYGGSVPGLTGTIKNFMIFDRALSSDTIASIAAGVGASTITTTITSDTTILHSTATIGSATITMPPSPLDGQIVRIATDQTITTFTLSPNVGQAFESTPPTTLMQNDSLSYLYSSVSTQWFRID